MEDKNFNLNDFQSQNDGATQEWNFVEEQKPAQNNKKATSFVIGGICLVLCILLGVLAFLWPVSKASSGGSSSSDTSDYSSDVSESSNGEEPDLEVSSAETVTSTVTNSSVSSSGSSNVVSTQTPVTSDSPESNVTEVKPVNKSAMPVVTEVAQMSSTGFVVAGYCSINTEKIVVTGDGVTETEIIPAKGTSNNYFMGTVTVKKSTKIVVQALEKNCGLSDAVTKSVSKKSGMSNLMTATEYTPVFCKDSRIHFYSALLAYSLSDVINDAAEARAKANISNIVNQAKQAGSEVIYFVVPSSASVYPETVPDGYKKATGETVFDVFNRVATQSGAKVVYPLDTMLAHKNDGEGLKIYHHTDSHWAPYGAFWGIHDLMNYISKEHPAAKPRTVEEMGFYTKEMWGGDALFSFASNGIFETNLSAGKTTKSKINELTAIYKKVMPTSTLISSYRNGKGVYFTGTNSAAATVRNSNGSGLPTAYIIRDSFGSTAYDMINDRFSTVWWQKYGNLQYTNSTVTANRPDYVIYIISERNIIKLMENNTNVSLLNFVR